MKKRATLGDYRQDMPQEDTVEEFMDCLRRASFYGENGEVLLSMSEVHSLVDLIQDLDDKVMLFRRKESKNGTALAHAKQDLQEAEAELKVLRDRYRSLWLSYRDMCLGE